MATGTTYKQCGCRSSESRKLLGPRCPQLRRPGGGWNPRHGTWSYQLELPPKAGGSRRSPLRRGGFASQTAAENELGKARELLAISNDQQTRVKIADLITGTIKRTRTLPEPEAVRQKIHVGQDLSRQTLLADWLEIWLKGKKKLADGTRARYASDIRLYLKPYLGHIPVDELRTADVASMFDAIEEYNDVIRQARASDDPDLRAKVKGRRVLSPASMRKVRATLRHALNIAIKQERLTGFNAASNVELPPADPPRPLVWTDERVRAWTARHREHLKNARPHANRKKINVLEAYFGTPRPSPVMVWTPEQIRQFLDHATRHRLYLLYRLIALRGLRRGEGCGIRWADTDLKDGVIDVCWQITQLHWHPRQGRPKTRASIRTIDLDKKSVQLLKAHRTRQAREHKQAGFAEAEFVFTDTSRGPLHPAYVTDEFQLLVYNAGLPPIRLHDLRHGAASLMLAADVDIKIVQETLGHVKSAYTRDVYTSVFPHLSKDAAEKTAAMIR